jgi:hypothetical protein
VSISFFHTTKEIDGDEASEDTEGGRRNRNDSDD